MRLKVDGPALRIIAIEAHAQETGMNIGSICTRTVVTVDRAAPLPEAARLMREHHVGALVVTQQVAEGTAVIGVVTDRDLSVEVLARGIDAGTVQVGQVLSSPVLAVAETSPLDEAVLLMQQHGVRRLLVTGAQGQLSGIVSLDDLLVALATQIGVLSQVVRAGLDREAQSRPAVAPPPIPPLRIPAMGTAGWTQPTRG